MLNMRYGYGTWDELKEMRRSIRAKREKEVYRQAELRKHFIETVTIVSVSLALALLMGVIIYFIGATQGKW